MVHPITTEEIQAAIDGQEAQVNTTDLDDILTAVQEDFEDFWSEHMAAVESGTLDLVAESDDAFVFADKTGEYWQEQFDALMDYVNLLGVEDEKIPDTVMSAHHNGAYRLTVYNWSTSNPVVVKKPVDFDDAQVFVEAVVNSLMKRGLSPGQAWAYYGVKIRGTSRNKWAQRCGYSDHSSVSEAVRKAKAKLGEYGQ